MNRFPLIAALAACIAVVLLMIRLGKLEGQLDVLKRGGSASLPAMALSSEQPEVAVYMTRIQVFSNKLWSAGKAGNLPLADFYRHEMKEAMEDLVKADILDDGVRVSDKMSVYGIRALDAFKADMRANGLKDFDAQYAALIAACNSCHTECAKPFIQVKVPTYTRYDDQEFAPNH